MTSREYTEKDLREAFDKFDSDKDGVINRVQFKLAMEKLGLDLNETEINELTNQATTLDKDSLEFSDFVEMCTIKLNENSEEMIKESFQGLDRFDEGFINVEKFKGLMTSVGEPLSDDEFKQLMSFVKLDAEGNFKYEELMAKIATKNPGLAFQKLT